MKVLRRRTFTCNGEGEYPGYECEEGGRIFPAFTHGQMLENQQVQAELVNEYGADSFAQLEYFAADWLEVYEDHVADVMKPIYVEHEGRWMQLFKLGPDWPWDL